MLRHWHILLRGGREARFWIFFGDLKVAVFGHEFENFLDLLAVGFRRQRAAPADIGAIRLQLRQRRQGHLGDQFKLAKLLQLAHDIERFVGLLDQVRLGPEHDAVDVLAARVVRGHVVHGHGHEVDIVEVGGRAIVGPLGAMLTEQLLKRGPGFTAEVGRNGFAGARHSDQVAEDVVGRQHQVGDLRRRGHLARAHGVEHGLEDVREADQIFETENAGAALDRMHGPEDGIDGVVRTAPIANVVKPRLDLLEGFTAFLEKGLLQLVQAAHDVALSVNCSGLKVRPC